MLTGRIEHLCRRGFIVGWALDTHRPLYPVPVQVCDARRNVLASGLAHCYRDAPHRTAGWHGFRLLTLINVMKLERCKLSLWNADTGECIARSRRVPLAPLSQTDGDDIDSITDDPTTLDTPAQLASLTDLFRCHQQQRGVEAFVRCCYAYVLGRPADHAGLRSYVEQLRGGDMQPYEVLLNLMASAEFQQRPTHLPAPWCAAFPFK